MPSKSKSKGNSFERDVAKLFTEVTGTNWTRVPTSGAFIGGKNAVRIEQLTENQTFLARGDIIPGDGFEKTILECKFYEDLEFHHLYRKEGAAKLNKWLGQVGIDHAVSNSIFYCVIFKLNRKGMFIAYPSELLTPQGNFTSYMDGKFTIEQFSKEWLINNLDKIKELNK